MVSFFGAVVQKCGADLHESILGNIIVEILKKCKKAIYWDSEMEYYEGSFMSQYCKGIFEKQYF